MPQDAFSPEGLREHLSRVRVMEEVQRPPDSPAVDTPMLAHPSLATRLSHLGLAGDGPSESRFVVEGVLGQGATARVYAVLDRNLARAVAVKFLGDGERRSSVDDIASFIKEAQITASLEHPNVLPVHELDVNETGQVYFSTKRIEGRSLGALIEQSAVGRRAAAIADFNAVVNIFVGVCQALAYAHTNRIVHQDVKPDNIMVGNFGEVLLVDWGSAARMQAGERPRLYGTPLYMSPEQARGEGVDERSDVYCLGATLFHTLVLRHPTWCDNVDEFWRMKRAGILRRPDAAEQAAVPEQPWPSRSRPSHRRRMRVTLARQNCSSTCAATRLAWP